MNSTSAEKSGEPVGRGYSFDLLTAVFLFLATAAVVAWQNSRLGVLWDLSYVLENAHRIALGDVPYRDFPFPYAPLTFLIQAALMKVTGRVFWHHILYCAAAGGLGTVLTWRILLRLLRDTATNSRLIAFLLSVPLIVVGVYCVFPHPFYDPDCTLAILLSVFLLLRLDDASSWRAFTTGVTLVIPLFVKQNIGLAFLLSGAAAIVVLIVFEVRQRRPIRRYLFVLVGMVSSLALAVFVIQFIAGLGNYWHWTITFAAERRAPSRGDMLGVYTDRTFLFSTGLFAAGVLFTIFARRNRVLLWLSFLLMSAPFAWPAIYLMRESDPSERADRLLALWPLVLVLSLVAGIFNIKTTM